MSRRLPPRPGEWIDREHAVAFRFEHSNYEGYHGDVLTSALWAHDVRMVGRSFKYHRPRGVYSLANHDINAMVEDCCGPRTNLRGDVLPIEEHLDVRAVNTFGGLHVDWLRITEWFSSFLPVGFYYKAFHTPRWLFPFYESQMRQVAGLGQIDPKATGAASPKDYAWCDLLIVGTGPAGLSAALAAAEHGVRVTLVEDQRRPGASWGWQWGGDPRAGQEMGRALARLAEFDHVEIRCATQAAGWYADHWVALVDDRRLTKLRASAMVVASGCIEQPAVFHNNDVPGCMLGSAAQRLMHLYAVKPFDRCVVLAANADAYRVAVDLYDAGVDVSAVADLRSEGESTPMARQLADRGVPVYCGYTVYEAVSGNGGSRVTGAVLSPLDGQNAPSKADLKRIDCDGIAVSVGWSPAGGLLYQAGVRFGYASRVEQFVPQSLPASVFAAGRVNGVFDLADQVADGRRAGLAAARFLGRYNGTVPDTPVHRGAAPSHPYPIYGHKKKKNFVDLDEDLHLADFVNAHQEGYDNVELMKRYTTVGMGPSQGKLSNMNAVRILAGLNGRKIDETGTTTSRPYYHPVPLSHLAGRRFHPQRCTAMHDWHVREHAVFMHAGTWLRPEYYKVPGRGRNETILNEALNVRRNVGLIDVGTLGKIYVGGPDAAAFLDRIYTGRFHSHRVGRLRYGLALDETGVIIEDGVIGRLAEDRFYVTATSSGGASFFRELQRWGLIWGMKVVLMNATGHLSAMNIAGPRAREVLEKLTTIDLDAGAFPYVGVREGVVADAPATIMRVGFVGELGFEVHVPASYGRHVWTRMMEAGSEFAIHPFGVEAQRLLRLEKGHLIISQDTDALTNPYEANVEWAIGKNKPFFVGQRSLAVQRGKPLTRRLAGFAFKSAYHGPLPDECHLVIAGDEITGRVTSIAKRSTLGYALGLAYLRPDMACPGTTIRIRVDGGQMVEAEVRPLPFYDPQNQRQN